MLIKLTQAGNGTELYIDHQMVRVVERNPGNPLITQIVSNFMTPKGPLAYEVREAPAEIAVLVNEAHKGNAVTSLITH